MEEAFKLRVKQSNILQIINIILKIYTIFLFFLALIIQSEETVIQSLIMVAAIVIFDFINEGEFIVTDAGIYNKENKLIRWREIESFSIQKNTITLKIKKERAKRIEINVREDRKNIENVDRYVNSKIRHPESVNFSNKK